MNLRTTFYFSLLTTALSACAAGGGSSAESSENLGSGNTSTGGAGTATSNPGIVIKPEPGEVDPSDNRDVPIRTLQCDENGENCTCLRLALLGTLDSAANNKDTQPFVDWLNGNSGGTATVTMVPTKPVLDETFLNQYDILIVANVNSWTFSAEEKTAVAAWSANGGGLITLTGFVSEPAEPAATSQLIEFSGIGYTSIATATQDKGQATPVYYQGGTVDLKNCLAWTESSDAIITTPIQFAPQEGTLSKLTHSLTYVGAFIGWGLTAPADATVVAMDPTSNQPMAVAKEVNQAGRVLAFGDEWIVFANQWEPLGNSNNTQQDEYNICWNMPTAEAEGFFHSVATLYQTKQFWYNAVNWVAPPNECNFTIIDTQVVVY